MNESNVDLLRHMQWWVLRMAGDELRCGETTLPPAPELAPADARRVYWWLMDCAEAVSPGINVEIEFRSEVGR